MSQLRLVRQKTAKPTQEVTLRKSMGVPTNTRSAISGGMSDCSLLKLLLVNKAFINNHLVLFNSD
jgi:hypothetical protein